MIHNPTRNTTDSIRCTGVAIQPLATIMATDGSSPWSGVGDFIAGASAANSMILQAHDGTNRVVQLALNTSTGVLAAYMRNAGGTQHAKSVTFSQSVVNSLVTFAVVWNGDGSTWGIRAHCNGETLSDLTGSTAQPFPAIAGVSLFDPVDTTTVSNGAEGHLQVHFLDIALSAEQFAAIVAQGNAGAWIRLHLAEMVWACGHALSSEDGAVPGTLPTAANLMVFHDHDNDGSTADSALNAVPASGVAVNGTGLRYSRPVEVSGSFTLRTQAQVGTGSHVVPELPIGGRNPAMRRLLDGEPAVGGDRFMIVSNSRGNLQSLVVEAPPTGGEGWQANYAAGLGLEFVGDFLIGSGNYQPRFSGGNGFLLDIPSSSSANATFHTGADDTPWDDWCRLGWNSAAGTSSTDATGPGMFARVQNTSNASHVRYIVDYMGLVTDSTPLTLRVLLLAHPAAPTDPIAIQSWDGTDHATVESLSLNTEIGNTTVVSYTGGATTIVLDGDVRAALMVGDGIAVEVSAGSWAIGMVEAINATLSGGDTEVTLEFPINHKATSTGRTIPTAGNVVRFGPVEWRWGTVVFAGAEPTKGLRVLMPGGAETERAVLVYAVEAWSHTLAGIITLPGGWGGHGYFLQFGGTWGGFLTVSARTGQSPFSSLMAALEIDCLIVTAAEQGSSASNTQLVLTEMARAYPSDWKRRTILASGPAMPATTSPVRWSFSDQTAEWAEWQAQNAPALGVPWLSAYAACGDAIDYWNNGFAHNNAHISSEGNRRAAEAWLAMADLVVLGLPSAGGGERSRSVTRERIPR